MDKAKRELTSASADRLASVFRIQRSLLRETGVEPEIVGRIISECEAALAVTRAPWSRSFSSGGFSRQPQRPLSFIVLGAVAEVAVDEVFGEILQTSFERRESQEHAISEETLEQNQAKGDARIIGAYQDEEARRES